MWFSALKLGLNAATHIYKKKQETKMLMSDAAAKHAEKMAKGELEYSGKLFVPYPSMRQELADITAIGNAHAAPVPTAFFISIPEIFSNGTLNIPPPIPNIDERYPITPPDILK